MSVKQTSDSNIDDIIKIASHIGFDFQKYKPSFLKRRIDTRLRLKGLNNYFQYLDLLDKDPMECNALAKAISINVTEFFRDKDVFSVFSNEIIPKLFEEKLYSSIRIWSAGCATGEEPYSLAILLNEAAKKQRRSFKIFATDINSSAIEFAKQGKYPLMSLKNLPHELLEKYFHQTDKNQYEISQEIKNFVTFNVGDISSFSVSYLDVIYCRNVFIYYAKETQDLILEKFHSLLKNTGFLILGMNENMRTEQAHMFESIVPRQRIYRKKEVVLR